MNHTPPFRIDSRRVASEPAWEIDVLETFFDYATMIIALGLIIRYADRFGGLLQETIKPMRWLLGEK